MRCDRFAHACAFAARVCANTLRSCSDLLRPKQFCQPSLPYLPEFIGKAKVGKDGGIASDQPKCGSIDVEVAVFHPLSIYFAGSSCIRRVR